MKSKGNHLRLVPQTAQVIPIGQQSKGAEVLYLRDMLKSNTIELAKHRERLLKLKEEIRKAKRARLRVVQDANQGSDPGKKS